MYWYCAWTSGDERSCSSVVSCIFESSSSGEGSNSCELKPTLRGAAICGVVTAAVLVVGGATAVFGAPVTAFATVSTSVLSSVQPQVAETPFTFTETVFASVGNSMK